MDVHLFTAVRLSAWNVKLQLAILWKLKFPEKNKRIGGHFKIWMFFIIVVFNDNFHQNIWDDTSFAFFLESNSLIINGLSWSINGSV
jgi:hypothetical protein